MGKLIFNTFLFVALNYIKLNIQEFIIGSQNTIYLLFVNIKTFNL